jgi:hypothetical protein
MRAVSVDSGTWCFAAMAVGIAVHWWPNTCPLNTRIFLATPLVHFQLLGAALELVLDGNGWVVAAPWFGAPDPAT